MTTPPRDAPAGRRAVLVGVVLVALLVGVLAMSAGADPATTRQPAPPIPSMDECEPNSPLPACQWGPTTTPAPTNQLPAPTPDAPAPTTGCVPGQIGCAPPPGTTPSSTPCAGEDCIPQPTTPEPSPGAPGQENDEQVDDPDCGLTDIDGCVSAGINGVFRGLVEAALSPILELLAATALSTPTIDQIPGLGDLWNHSFEIVIAAYGLLILIGGIVVMSHETLQTRYSLKEIGPRIPVAFLGATLSLFAVDKLIRLANGLSTAILGDGVAPPSLGDTLNDAAAGALTGGLFLILTALVLVVIGIGLLIVYVIRVVITVLLIITGPLFLMFHALPHTDGLARWWWKATIAVLAIQVVQSLVLIVAVRTLLTGGMHLFSSFGAFGTLIGAIGLFVVVFKVPFWLLAVVRIGSGGSMVMGLAKAYVAAKTFGMISNRTSATRPARTPVRQRNNPTYTPATHTAVGHAIPVSSRGPATAQRRSPNGSRPARIKWLPSPKPAFLQPGVQATTHDPAIDLTGVAPAAVPTFSARSRRHAAPHADPARRLRSPDFRPPVPTDRQRPLRAAATPPALRFRSATPEARHARTPMAAHGPPAPPAFRESQPLPRVGDARRRTPSVPPLVFRAPAPRGGSKP